MPYQPQHKQRTRARIVDSARQLFNNRGFNNVSIEDIMAGAGLTRGGFYAHFKNKGELFAEAVTSHLTRGHDAAEELAAMPASPDIGRQVVEAYLSVHHAKDVSGGCPLVALPSDASRASSEVKQAYQEVYKALVDMLERHLSVPPGRAHETALSLATLCVGSVALARAMDDEELGLEIIASGQRMAMKMAGWA